MRYEKEMIPILNDFLCNAMGYSVIANEIDSGYGIADVVATVDGEHCNYYHFNNIIDVFLLNSLPLNKFVSFEDIYKISSYSEKYLKYTLLKRFIEDGLLEKDTRGIRRIKKLTTNKNPVIAIEAKLKRWNEALLQAKRYRKYADFCYVALPEKTVKNVSLNLYKENGIGILSISQSKTISQIIKPKKNKDKNELYALYINGILFKQSAEKRTWQS